MSERAERIELTLKYEAGAWHAAGGGVTVSHADLAGLDRLILDAFGTDGRARRIHVRFDRTGLPSWLRQYQAHYFNYVLRVDTTAREERA